MDWTERKIRSDDTWGEVRRGWEAGETGASLARRYDVGLDNLWRRRASEGWRRPPPADRAPEPIEGWDRRAARKRETFEARREETRLLAVKLAETMQGGSLKEVPLWHVGFVLTWRAERLGAQATAADRDYLAAHDWSAELWDEAGELKPLAVLDEIVVQANREAWREDMGLPPGVAEDVP